MREFILNALEEIQNGYSLCGVVDRRDRVYPLGSDTKSRSVVNPARVCQEKSEES